jgi:hypothetical protein
MRAAWAAATDAWFTPVAVLLGLFDVFGAIHVLRDPESTMPGRVIGPAIMLMLGSAMFAGLYLRWVSRYGGRGGSVLAGGPAVRNGTWLAGLAGLGVVATIIGVMRGPIVLLAGGVAALVSVAVGSTRRPRAAASAQPGGPRAGAPSVVLADVLIILGLLPALGLWWMIVPPILAFLVLAGVIGTGPGVRRRARVA